MVVDRVAAGSVPADPADPVHPWTGCEPPPGGHDVGMGTQRNTSDPRQPRQAGQQPDPDDLTDDELDEDTPQPRQPGEQPGSPQS